MSSHEFFPPLIIDGTKSIVGLLIDPEHETISITHHTQLENETDKEKLRSPIDFTSVHLSISDLKWLAPKLEAIREQFGIENGYKK